MNNKTETFFEYKKLLFSMAYNMLGRVEVAEDIVQDTFLKWMELKSNEIAHPKAYLMKIITNKCINYLNSARSKRENYIGLWLPEPLPNYYTDNFTAQTESYHALSFGILVLLERLTPQERAIFLLREIFAYDYAELSGIFDKSQENCRQIFKRAKANLGNDSRRFEVDLKLHEKMLNNFLRAVSGEGMEGLIDLLKEDVMLLADGGGKMLVLDGQRFTAVPNPVFGRENVLKLLTTVMPKIMRHIPDFKQEIIMVNGLPSIISYTGNIPFSLVSIEHDGDRIRNIYIQSNTDKLKRFVKKS